MRIARHSFYNLLGMGLPLLLALLAIPELLRLLGTERFGWLTLLWALVSYMGLFDLGLPRALTQQLAPAVSRQRWAEAGAIGGTVAALVAGLGLLLAVVLWWAAPALAALLTTTTEAERLVVALRWMAAALPLTLMSTAMRGALEACHAFRGINAIRLPLGLWTFAGPWAIAAWREPDLGDIAAALAFGRLAALLAHGALVMRVLHMLRGLWRWEGARCAPLLRAGGWLTVGNVISPLMGYSDRFFLGIVVSGTAAAYYAAPQEIVTKLWIIPGALTAVLLPEFATRATEAGEGSWRLFDAAVAAIFMALLPLTLGLALFSHELLGLWLGPEIAMHSGPLLVWFALGIQINCVAHIALTWLHARGRYRAPALLQVVEFPLFLLLLWGLSTIWGLQGAAIAWLLRMAVDCVSLFALCGAERRGWPSRTWGGAVLLAGLLFVAASWDSLPLRLLLWSALVAAVTVLAWRWRTREALASAAAGGLS
ncbi:oligosaccharide flippase family protein [Roseateles asaccharophilus]|uniref:O-antigen/teichoic acid export membrane protein n=1 Tax=Roseateles asaccharophilus TaxID=582607 RepID=A0ABU2AE10_9BURK|nr:oligosaccharide flippase family protein [Roseateles asaccharophilus]MDR7334722.1 O-antigen/teichoic acid export membrane protein [Roseateles asaccharophilus]